MILKNVNLGKIVFRKELISLIILFLFTNMDAQLNSEVGYSGAFIPMKNTNKIIDRYNSDSKLLTSMKSLNYTGGFHVGVSYRFGFVKIGGFWEGLNAKRIGVKGDLLKNIAVEKKLFFYFNSFSGSMEFLVKNIGIGGAIDKNYFKIKTVVNGTSSKVPVMKTEYYSSKIYFILYLRGTEKLGMAIKPFVRLPWQDNSMSELAKYLEIPENDVYKKENFIQYGVTIVLLNGLQPDI